MKFGKKSGFVLRSHVRDPSGDCSAYSAFKVRLHLTSFLFEGPIILYYISGL